MDENVLSNPLNHILCQKNEADFSPQPNEKSVPDSQLIRSDSRNGRRTFANEKIQRRHKNISKMRIKSFTYIQKSDTIRKSMKNKGAEKMFRQNRRIGGGVLLLA